MTEVDLCLLIHTNEESQIDANSGESLVEFQSSVPEGEPLGGGFENAGSLQRRLILVLRNASFGIYAATRNVKVVGFRLNTALCEKVSEVG